MSTEYTKEDVYKFATNGNFDELEIALNQGNNSNDWYRNPPSNYTAVHVSSNNGHDKCLKLLIDKGIDVAAKNKQGYSALHVAAKSGRVKCLQLLLDTEKLDINDKCNILFQTALQYAIREGHVDCVELLLDRNARADVKTRSGRTCLHLAAIEGHFQCFKILLDRGADINGTNNDDDTALMDAASRGQEKCVEVLLELRAEIHNDINRYSPEGNPFNSDQAKYTDCRPMILAEVEHRRKRTLFDSFINHHIEYQPYINNIYTLCYPTGNLRVAKPSISWEKAERVRDNYYYDEVFFHLHMGIAKFYSNNRPGTITNSLMSNGIDYFAKNSDKTSTLMTVLSDRLKLMLKPNDLQ